MLRFSMLVSPADVSVKSASLPRPCDVPLLHALLLGIHGRRSSVFDRPAPNGDSDLAAVGSLVIAGGHNSRGLQGGVLHSIRQLDAERLFDFGFRYERAGVSALSRWFGLLSGVSGREQERERIR